MRLRTVPSTRPLAEINRWSSNTQNSVIAATNIVTWQLLSHRPALTGPILPMSHGATQVESTSKTTPRDLATPMWVELYPAESRYVTIWPEKLNTVR